MRESKLRTLLLSLEYGHRASYYDDWRDAFLASPDYLVEVRNIIGLRPKDLARDLEEFDAIVVLHSCNADTLDYFERIAETLGQRKRARLLAFVGNEYNSPYLSTAKRNLLLRTARADIVATQLLLEAGEYLYRDVGARVIAVPHALNDSVFRPGPPSANRRIDIGLRGYRYPTWLGDEDRNKLIQRFIDSAGRYRLNVDIGVDQRTDRTQWAEFLRSCRGTISTEVGSWYISPEDGLISEIRDYLRSRQQGLVIKNDSYLRRMVRRMPMVVKAGLWRVLKSNIVRFEVLEDSGIPFAELDTRFFQANARPPVYGKAISSRHFDAIGSKTCQLMLRGRFNDILVPDLHYLAIQPDYSNLDEVIEKFRDPLERDRIAREAFELVQSAHTYSHRTKFVRSSLDRLL